MLISEISLIGTSTPIAETGEKVYSFTLTIPFLHFAMVAIVFFAAFLVFDLFFQRIWAD